MGLAGIADGLISVITFGMINPDWRTCILLSPWVSIIGCDISEDSLRGYHNEFQEWQEQRNRHIKDTINDYCDILDHLDEILVAMTDGEPAHWQFKEDYILRLRKAARRLSPLTVARIARKRPH